MHSESGSEVVSQNHAHIHPPERVGLGDDLPRPEHAQYRGGPPGVAPANDDAGQRLRRIGVTEKDHVNTLGAQHSGSGSGDALPPGPIQDLDHEPPVEGRDRERVIGNRVGPVSQQKAASGAEQNDCRAQREPAAVATKLFQKRTVGSRIGHPVFTR